MDPKHTVRMSAEEIWSDNLAEIEDEADFDVLDSAEDDEVNIVYDNNDDCILIDDEQFDNSLPEGEDVCAIIADDTSPQLAREVTAEICVNVYEGNSDVIIQSTLSPDDEVILLDDDSGSVSGMSPVENMQKKLADDTTGVEVLDEVVEAPTVNALLSEKTDMSFVDFGTEHDVEPLVIADAIDEELTTAQLLSEYEKLAQVKDMRPVTPTPSDIDLSVLPSADISEVLPDLTYLRYRGTFNDNCPLCGEYLATVSAWLLHHDSERHRQVIAWLGHLRATCIDSACDADAGRTSAAQLEAESVKDSVLYCQELFERPGLPLICAVCCTEVKDLKAHITSSVHNEAYANVVYPYELLKIKKISTLRHIGLNRVVYKRKIQRLLQDELPRTEECPLEIVSVDANPEKLNWIVQFMKALAWIRRKRPASLELPSMNTSVQNNVYEGEQYMDEAGGCSWFVCDVCRTKHFSRDAWKTHLSSNQHLHKLAIYQYIANENNYIVLPDRAPTILNEIKACNYPIVGTEYIWELLDRDGRLSYWVCRVCSAGMSAEWAMEHFRTTRHAQKYIEMFYPELKSTQVKSVKGMTEETHRICEQLLSDDTSDMHITVAQMVNDIPVRQLEQRGDSASATSVALQSGSNAVQGGRRGGVASSTVHNELQPKILAADVEQELLWCEACWTVIFVNKANWSTAKAWAQHVVRETHKNKVAVRRQFIFDDKNFLEEPSSLQSDLAKVKDISLVGLEYVIERRNYNAQTQLKTVDVVCLLCAETIDKTQVYAHVTGGGHIYQYIHKAFPQDVQRLFCTNPEKQLSEVETFIHQKNIPRRTIRVYDPKPAMPMVAKANGSAEANVSTQSAKPKESVSKLSKMDVPPAAKPAETKRSSSKDDRHSVKSVTTSSKSKGRSCDKSSSSSGSTTRKTWAASSSRSRSSTRNRSSSKNKNSSKSAGSAIKGKLQKSTQRSSVDATKKSGNAGAVDKTPMAVKTDGIGDKKDEKARASDKEHVKDKESQSLDDKSKGEKVDVADPILLLLLQSMIGPINLAYVQPWLDKCPEPLIGVGSLSEFLCTDTCNEPGYLCQICKKYMVTPEAVVDHLVGSEHRMRYLELNYKSYHSSIQTVHGSKGVSTMLKQYAREIEQREGTRRRVTTRLSMKVDTSVLKNKKRELFFTPPPAAPSAVMGPPPFMAPPLMGMPGFPLGMAPPVSMGSSMFHPGMVPFGVPPSFPMGMPVGPGGEVFHPSQSSSRERARSRDKLRARSNERMRARGDEPWGDKCEKFLRKLEPEGASNDGIGANGSMASLDRNSRGRGASDCYRRGRSRSISAERRRHSDLDRARGSRVSRKSPTGRREPDSRSGRREIERHRKSPLSRRRWSPSRSTEKARSSRELSEKHYHYSEVDNMSYRQGHQLPDPSFGGTGMRNLPSQMQMDVIEETSKHRSAQDYQWNKPTSAEPNMCAELTRGSGTRELASIRQSTSTKNPSAVGGEQSLADLLKMLNDSASSSTGASKPLSMTGTSSLQQQSKPSGFDQLLQALVGSKFPQKVPGTAPTSTEALLLKLLLEERQRQENQEAQERRLLAMLAELQQTRNPAAASSQVYDYSHGGDDDRSSGPNLQRLDSRLPTVDRSASASASAMVPPFYQPPSTKEQYSLNSSGAVRSAVRPSAGGCSSSPATSYQHSMLQNKASRQEVPYANSRFRAQPPQCGHAEDIPAPFYPAGTQKGRVEHAYETSLQESNKYGNFDDAALRGSLGAQLSGPLIPPSGGDASKQRNFREQFEKKRQETLQRYEVEQRTVQQQQQVEHKRQQTLTKFQAVQHQAREATLPQYGMKPGRGGFSGYR